MVNGFFYGIILIVTLSFLFERRLEYLNGRRRGHDLPSEVADVYDSERYEKQQAYKGEKERLDVVGSSVQFAAIIVMLLTGAFGWINEVAGAITTGPIWRAVAFFAMLGLAADVLGTPFSIYNTFVIEERYGFNKTTPATFVLDKLKGWLLSLVIGGGLLALILWIYFLTAGYFWLLAWAAITAFSLFVSMFYSQLVVPLFNKQRPLEAGELRDKLEAFSEQEGFALKDIYVIDGSKRSTKANAYFSGLGPKKRIVLYDTLIEELEDEQIVAVLAHEIGHYKKRHVVSQIILSTLQTGVFLFVLSLFLDNPALSQALGANEAVVHINLIGFALLFTPISLLTGLGRNWISRRHEYEADRFAAERLGAVPLVNGLKRLSKNNLSNLTPHPLYVKVHYSHPTLLQRIRAMQAVG
ncbi:MAG: M48 family metallopeptidase [Spirochaetota bacterium]